MKVLANNKELYLVFPEQTEKQHRTEILPYYQIFGSNLKKDFKRKISLVKKISEDLEGKYSSYLELLAGLGITASFFNCEKMYLNDLDEICYANLISNFPEAESSCVDYTQFILEDKEIDFAFLDFNNFTIKKYLENKFDLKQVIENCTKNIQKYIVVNDSTVFYMKYGESSFKNLSKFLGSNIKSLEEYNEELSRHFYKNYGWSLTRSYSFNNMQYFILEKGLKENIVHYKLGKNVENFVTIV
jgi:hypothetical protein